MSKIYSFNPLLKNQFVLYFFLFITIIDLLYLINVQDTNSLVIFATIAFVTTFFNKNMIVVLCLALVITHIVKHGSKSYQDGFSQLQEGFKESKKTMTMKKGEAEEETVEEPMENESEEENDMPMPADVKMQKPKPTPNSKMQNPKPTPPNSKMQKTMDDVVESMDDSSAPTPTKITTTIT